MDEKNRSAMNKNWLSPFFISILQNVSKGYVQRCFVFPASPCMGDIQLSFYDRKGVLEVEVIRARGLLPKPGSKILPGKLLHIE